MENSKKKRKRKYKTKVLIMEYVLSFILFIVLRVVGSCPVENSLLPEGSFCSHVQNKGTSIVITSDAVPSNRQVTCSCDVRVTWASFLLVTYNSPGYPNCGITVEFGEKGDLVYVCDDSLKKIDVPVMFRITFIKTITTDNPAACFKLETGNNSSIDVTCYNEEPGQKATSRVSSTSVQTGSDSPPLISVTNNPERNTLSSLPTPAVKSKSTSSTATEENISSPVTMATNVTATPMLTIDKSNTTSDAVSESTYLPSSASRTTSRKSPARPLDSTTTKFKLSTVSTNVTSENFTSRAVTSTITFLSWTSVSSLNFSEATESPVSTQTFSNISDTTPVARPAAVTNAGTSFTVIIVSTTACASVLLLVTAGVILIVSRKKRATRKQTFTPHIPPIDAFQTQSRGSIIDDNGVVSTDYLSEPSSDLYSIPKESAHHLSASERLNKRQAIAMQNKARKCKVELLRSFALPPDNSENLDYDSIAGFNSWQAYDPDPAYDHVHTSGLTTFSSPKYATDLYDLPTDRLDRLMDHESMYDDVTSKSRTAKHNVPDISTDIGREAHFAQQYQAEGTSPLYHFPKSASDIYAIVRKPKLGITTKRTKLVTFQGDTENEESAPVLKGILKNKPDDSKEEAVYETDRSGGYACVQPHGTETLAPDNSALYSAQQSEETDFNRQLWRWN